MMEVTMYDSYFVKFDFNKEKYIGRVVKENLVSVEINAYRIKDGKRYKRMHMDLDSITYIDNDEFYELKEKMMKKEHGESNFSFVAEFKDKHGDVLYQNELCVATEDEIFNSVKKELEDDESVKSAEIFKLVSWKKLKKKISVEIE
jgi:hypothetical protein